MVMETVVVVDTTTDSASLRLTYSTVERLHLQLPSYPVK